MKDMNSPYDLTAEQVRSELAALIEKFPDRTGSIPVGDGVSSYDEFSCVYFTDENDVPISLTYFDETDDPVMVTPVCIVGQWIEDFHPELKFHNMVREILLKNHTLSAMDRNEIPFKDDVWKLLSTAQDVQDGSENTWKDIKL